MSLPSPDPSTTVVVTGATSGIGEALARELAGRGYGLSLVARRVGRLAHLADELSLRHAVEVDTHPADVSRDGDRRRLLDELRSRRVVVGLCNDAGTGAFGRVVDHDPADEDYVFRTNALAVHELTTVLAGDMVDQGVGAILNVASVLAFAPIPQNATYAATKAFIASFSEALHTELAGTAVSCTVVNPGPTRTGVFRASGTPGITGFGPDLLWQRPEQVARDAVEAMAHGRRSVIPGWTNKLMALSYHLTPRTALLPVARVAQSGPVRRLLFDDGAEDVAQ